MTIHYERITQRVTIAAGQSAQAALIKQTMPFEDVSIWVQPLIGGSVPVGGYDVIPQLNGQAVTSQQVLASTSLVPQQILIPGIFPPDVADYKNPGSQNGGAYNGVTPGVQVVNHTSQAIVFAVTIIARVMGAGV